MAEPKRSAPGGPHPTPGAGRLVNGLPAATTAQLLKQRGLVPVPLHPGEKRPIGDGWGDAAVGRTSKEIWDFFKVHQSAGVGVLLGPLGGVIALDPDTPEAVESVRTLFEGDPPPTLSWTSTRGAPMLFEWDDRLEVIGKAVFAHESLPGLEVRLGAGGKAAQQACPPTPGTDGAPRRWGDVDEIAPLPESVIRKLVDLAKAPATNGAPGAPPFVGRAFVSTATPEAWARAALARECDTVANAPVGTRNATLNRAAYVMGGHLHEGHLLESEVIDALTAAGRRGGLDDAEIAPTVRSGIDAGRARPLPTANALIAPSAGGAPAVGWPNLQLDDPAPPVDAFPVDALPGTVGDFARTVATSIGCPVDFAAVAALTVAAGAIGRSVALELKPDYRVVAALYAAIVGPPSDGKSPSLRAALDGLVPIENDLRSAFDSDVRSWEIARDAAQKSHAPSPPKPRPKRVWVGDATTEALIGVLADNPRGVVLATDELTSLLLGMNQYKKGGGNDRPVYLSAWAGATIVRDRVSNPDRVPIRVPRPCLTVVGGMTPATLGAIPGRDQADDGFIDRFLFVYPDPAPTPTWSWGGVPQSVVDSWRSVVGRLWARPMSPFSPDPVPNIVRLGPDAGDAWRDGFDRLAGEMNAPGFDPVLRGPWGKFRDHAARLALVLACLRHADDATLPAIAPPNVGAGDVVNAWRLTAYFQTHAKRVHAAIRGGCRGHDSRVSGAVLSWVRAGRLADFSEAELHRARRWMTGEERSAALRDLTRQGALRPQGGASVGPKGGRPQTPRYEVNPAVHTA